MPGVKRSHDDSDNEDVDQETDSDHSSVDDFGLSEGSESEESSELDEQECDTRRTLYATDLGDLERQFGILREQLYRERLRQVELHLSTVRSGDAGEYLAPLDQLREAHSIRNEVAGIMRQLKISNIRNKHEAEELAANQNYENEKALLLSGLRDELESRIQALQEDRTAIAVTSRLWAEQNLRRSPRSPVKGTGKQHGKAGFVVEGPYIVYCLREEDILEDWTAIRRAVQANKHRRNKFGRLCSSRPVGQNFGLGL